jgi:hypothetical protein
VLERRQVGERWRTERWESLRFQFPNWSLELPGYTIWRSQRASTACWTRLRSSLPGVRTGADPDRILTTLLFTDIVNSTTLAAQLGDRRWRDVLDQHSELGRGELARLGGREVVTTGTASSRPSTVRSRPCGVPLPWWRRCQQLGSRFAPVSIPGRSRYVGRIWEGWRSTSRLWFAALAGDGQVLVSSTVKVCSSALVWASMTDESVSSKGCPEPGGSLRQHPAASRSGECDRAACLHLILYWMCLITQTIRQDPPRSDQIDDPSNLSRPDPSGADQIDPEDQATDLAVGGS